MAPTPGPQDLRFRTAPTFPRRLEGAAVNPHNPTTVSFRIALVSVPVTAEENHACNNNRNAYSCLRIYEPSIFHGTRSTQTHES